MSEIVGEDAASISSANSVTFGIYSQHLRIPAEQAEAFGEFAQAFDEDLDPQNSYERIIVSRIVVASWKIEQLVLLESEIFAAQLAGGLKERLMADPTEVVVSPFSRQIADLNRSVASAAKELECYRKGKLALSKRSVQPVQESYEAASPLVRGVVVDDSSLEAAIERRRRLN